VHFVIFHEKNRTLFVHFRLCAKCFTFPRARRAVCVHTRFLLKIKYICISFSHLNTLIFTLFCTTENTLFRGDTFVKKYFVGAVRRRAWRVCDIFRKYVFITHCTWEPRTQRCVYITYVMCNVRNITYALHTSYVYIILTHPLARSTCFNMLHL